MYSLIEDPPLPEFDPNNTKPQRFQAIDIVDIHQLSAHPDMEKYIHERLEAQIDRAMLQLVHTGRQYHVRYDPEMSREPYSLDGFGKPTAWMYRLGALFTYEPPVIKHRNSWD